MLSLFEKVQKLQFNVLADIAKRAGGLTRTPMSVTGTYRTDADANQMSVIEGKADMARASLSMSANDPKRTLGQCRLNGMSIHLR